jgi:hypothetical protein
MPQDVTEHDRGRDGMTMSRTAYPWTMPVRTGPLATTLDAMDQGPHVTNAEMAQLVALLKERGLIEIHTDEQGRQVYRLTDDGVRLGNMLAMVEGADADAVLDALLTSETNP